MIRPSFSTRGSTPGFSLVTVLHVTTSTWANLDLSFMIAARFPFMPCCRAAKRSTRALHRTAPAPCGDKFCVHADAAA
jgi:hypothetical protein